MNDLLGRSPSTKQLGRRAQRLLTEDEDTRSLIAGLILTLILWPTLFWLFGKGMGHISSGRHPKFAQSKPKPAFSIQLAPDQFLMPKKPAPLPDRFVETNPNAPENIPDKTRNFAAQNQQVAQEKPTPEGKNDMPAMEGKKDFQSTQIVSGDLNPPEKQTPPPPDPTPEVAKEEKQAEARREQTPLPGFEKREGESKEGIGSSIAEATTHATPVPERVQGAKDAPIDGPTHPTTAQSVPQKPLPRPRLQQVHARPAIFAENKVGTRNIGPIAVDARWSNYGQYLQKLLETVQIQWERIIVQSSVYPPPGSTVTVKFRLEASEGQIAEIIDTESTGGKQAAEACKSAITARAPYGKWTDDMVAVLGESQEMTFTFYYNP